MSNQPNTYYEAGLRNADSGVLQDIYTEFRPSIVRSVITQGGNAADGAVFFQTAVIEAAQMAHSGEFPEDQPFFLNLQKIALAHHLSWLTERGRAPEIPVEQPDWLPNDDSLTATRRKIFTWKHLNRLEKNSQVALLKAPDAPETAALRNTLRLSLVTPSGTVPPDPELPDWAKDALYDGAGFKIWQATHLLDYRIGEGLPLDGKQRVDAGNIAKYIVLGLLVLLVGSAVRIWIMRPTSVDPAVFQQHFEQPQGIMEEILKRDAADTANLTDKNRACLATLLMADPLYKAGELNEARQLLLDVLDDPASEACYSDASYFLGVIFLQMDQPEEALLYFSKIDNLERYGEDLYYHQALCFVKMAEQNGVMRPVAKRSLERLLENTQDSVRRAKALDMLKSLEE